MTDPYYEQLIYQNEELEMEVQIQCEENERLRQKIEKLQKQVRSLKAAGRKMYDFIEEGIGCDLFHDETLDAANKSTEAWYDTDYKRFKK